MAEFLGNFSFMQVASAFIVLFAIIDPFGCIPIVLNIEHRGIAVKPLKVVLISYVIMLSFFFAGDWILQFLGVDIRAFAIAGAIILFIMALEMLLDVEIFKYTGPEGTGSIIPLAFPLFAGPGVFTALLTIRAEYDNVNILTAVTLNVIFLYAILKSLTLVKKTIGESGIYILRKFFGMILLAISVKIFVENVALLFGIHII
ncbi:MAG: MarC family protein [Paludibacteraceae bacterium]|nr:MarC family protein [Paludibacteraceae bacterium]